MTRSLRGSAPRIFEWRETILCYQAEPKTLILLFPFCCFVLIIRQCFWHIQHEFIEGERSILGRNDHQLTSAAGYAGGKSTDSEGRVCYHNFQGVAGMYNFSMH